MKIGFIGCGKMAQAIMEGMIKKGNVQTDEIMVSAKTETTLQKAQEKYSVKINMDNKKVAEWADLIILAIKPDLHKSVIQEIKEVTNTSKVIVTIAAGITLDSMEQLFGREIKSVRAMPNTPSLVGEGMTALCFHPRLSSEEQELVLRVFQAIGQVEVFEESMMDSIPAISGSSPAYVYIMIEALADGGVRQGLPRDKAYKLAAQAVLGAAKMVLDSGVHPGQLKDQVCTPGGATIEAVAALEEKGFRASVLTAMERCTQKVWKLSGRTKRS